MPTRHNLLDADLLTNDPPVNLTRRRSMLSKRSNSRNVALSVQDNSRMPIFDPMRSGPSVPTELLNEIIKFYFEGVTAFRRASQRVLFRDIQLLTLVSRDVRYLILRQFCRRLCFLAPQDANEICVYLTSVAGFDWVRTIAMPAFLLLLDNLFLKRFENLRDLIIDCSHCSLSTHVSIFSRLFGVLRNEDNFVSSLRSFTMTDVPCLDDGLLRTIAASLPQVVDLHISTIEGIEMGCCRNCYEQSLDRVLHSPVQDIYLNGRDVAEKFADALEGFRDLKNLHLGVLLSPCDLLNKHSKHGVGASDAKPSTVKNIPNCCRCKRYAQETSRCELSAGLAIANRLPSLETISWITAFPVSFSRDGKISTENCVECDMDRYPNSLKFSIVNSQYAEDLENDHWKIACFAVQRTYNKLRLLRTA